mmetsp:Transcript_7039/g.30938  ORF Transcript_7039/g.30938 Transcript_7039/m.30938 type:complete len:203 (+) Transcript_7039:1069-1677(+)
MNLRRIHRVAHPGSGRHQLVLPGFEQRGRRPPARRFLGNLIHGFGLARGVGIGAEQGVRPLLGANRGKRRELRLFGLSLGLLRGRLGLPLRLPLGLERLDEILGALLADGVVVVVAVAERLDVQLVDHVVDGVANESRYRELALLLFLGGLGRHGFAPELRELGLLLVDLGLRGVEVRLGFLPGLGFLLPLGFLLLLFLVEA